MVIGSKYIQTFKIKLNFEVKIKFFSHGQLATLIIVYHDPLCIIYLIKSIQFLNAYFVVNYSEEYHKLFYVDVRI